MSSICRQFLIGLARLDRGSSRESVSTLTLNSPPGGRLLFQPGGPASLRSTRYAPREDQGLQKDRFEARATDAPLGLRSYRNVRIAAVVLWQPLFAPSRGSFGHKCIVDGGSHPASPQRTKGFSGKRGGFSLATRKTMLHRSITIKRRSMKKGACPLSRWCVSALGQPLL